MERPSGKYEPLERGEPTEPAFLLANALQEIMHEIPERDFNLMFHQEEGLRAMIHRLFEGDTEGYINTATSTGKTLLEAVVTEAAIRAGLRVHVLGSRRKALDQFIGADGQRGLGRFTNLTPDLVGRNYDGNHAAAEHPVVASTYHGFLNEAKSRQQGSGNLGEFDIVIADECHKSLGDETSAALYHYMPGAIKIGFSATPDYAVDRQSAEVFDHSWFEFPLRPAVESGVTAPIRSLLFQTDSAIETTHRGTFTEKELAPLIGDIQRNGLALQLAQDFIADGRQGIIACIPGGNNTHATTMAHMLSQLSVGDRQIVAADIGNHLHKDEESRRLDAFQSGEIDVLTFTRSLEESWDSDRPSFCINAAPTTSLVRTTQLLGRIVRPNPDGRESVYIDFVDKTGTAKQFTAFHALDIEHIDMNQVLGYGYARSGSSTASQDVPLTLRPELYDKLMRVQGKLLSEAIIGRGVDPHAVLKAHWNRKLTQEGLPAELPYNITHSPKLSKIYGRAKRQLASERIDEPSHQEMLEFLKNRLSIGELNTFRRYGQRALITDEQLHSLTDPHDPLPDTSAEEDDLRHNIHKVLDTHMDERTAGILKLRYGLTAEGRNLSYTEVGQRFHISSARVGQLVIQGLALLRERGRQYGWEGYQPDDNPNPIPVSHRHMPRHTLVTLATRAFPTAEELMSRSDDLRSDTERYEEICRHRAAQWYSDRIAQLTRRNKAFDQSAWLHHEMAAVKEELDAIRIVREQIQTQAVRANQAVRQTDLLAFEIREQKLRQYQKKLQHSPHNTSVRKSN